MSRKTEKGGKFRNVHCRTWNMARKLKIMEHEPNRIQRLATIEPNTYKFVMKSREEGGLGYCEVMDYLGIPYETTDNK